MRLKDLAVEEMWVGGVIAVAWCYFMGWWSALAIPAAAFLWALGGAKKTSKSWRRLGVPAVIVGLIYLQTQYDPWFWLALSALGFFGALTIGYGIPTWDNSGTMTDEGSWLGSRIYKLVGGQEVQWDVGKQAQATDVCRGVIGALIGLALLPLAWTSLVGWLFGATLCTIGYPAVVRIVE